VGLKPSQIVCSFESLESADQGGQRCPRSQEFRISKGLPRSFDVVVSLIGLVLTSPLLVVLAPIIALTSPGGFLFRQKRVGHYGELFVLYKLRTMRASNIGPQITKRGDRRITRVGKFLRKTKLDELPTLWNVLRGDMALVGPRPEVPQYVKLEDPMWQAVLAARQGITDPVTVRLRNEEELLAQVEDDTEKYYLNELQPSKLKGYIAYLEKRNWRTDFSVLCRTLAAVVVPHEAPQLDENGGSFQTYRE
jgi:lipopolysaccharide/colanic/teichoic acid biosynthesis glycosyltransferase